MSKITKHEELRNEILNNDSIPQELKDKMNNLKTEFEMNCYGISEATIREEYMDSITAKFSGLEMVVMGILSDCQELGAMNQTEMVRKQLNVAKFILSEMMEAKQPA